MVKKRKDREDSSDDGVTHGSPLKKIKVFCGLSKKIQLKYVKEKINDTTTHTHTRTDGRYYTDALKMSPSFVMYLRML